MRDAASAAHRWLGSADVHNLARTGALGIERLAAFKTPRKILFLAEIPKGATRKLQGIGLAQKLGLERDAAN
jgi:hypothetical protein